MKSAIVSKYLIGLFVVFLLTACGSGNVETNTTGTTGTTDATGTTDTSLGHANWQITGGGIKGPLAFANVNIFALDPSFPDSYDKNAPIASAITNEYAQIDDLSIPWNILPPYVLTVGGINAIDLDTGMAPVISTLITVITEDMLADNRPIYATPLTTLVFYMAAQSAGASADTNFFVQQVGSAATQVSQMFAIDPNTSIDVFGSPLVINDATVTLAAQQEAVHHRAAVEAFAAKVHNLTLLKGDGLQATYYNDLSFSNAALERVDATVDFDWLTGSPDAAVNADGFSARWTGVIEPQFSETYTFYTSTDDGVRLWVDGQLIVDHWADQAETEFSGTITLTAGNKYSIVMEYYDNAGDAVAKLLWSSASQPKSVVAKQNLYSVTDPTLLENITPNTLIKRLARDLQSDGVIDNAANGTMIGGIDPAILNQDSMTLQIPNTAYLVGDIMTLMEEERISIGTDTGPIFLVDSIVFGNQSYFTLSVDSLNFGSQVVGGTSNPLSLTLTNTSSGSLPPSGFSISSGFTVTNNCVDNLPVGGSCIFDVRFTPTIAGNITGELSITDPSGTPHVVSLSGSSNNAADIIFQHDFNDEARHTYTQSDVINTWNAYTMELQPNAVKIVQDPDTSRSHGNVMEVFYPAGSISDAANQWEIKIGAYNELYFAYDVFFESDADFVKTGKLPYLGPNGYYSNPGVIPDGTDRWTGNLIWRENGKIASYIYHADQPWIWGEDFDWNSGAGGQTYFQRGRWTRVEMYYKMNTPGILDGRLKGWVNGELSIDTDQIMYRMPGGEHLDIGVLIFKTFYGGGDSSFAPSKDQHIYFDNFVVSTQPITH